MSPIIGELMSMTYNFETLTPERFQQLCQALLASTFPNLQCLPVAQPDGGRDAYLRLASLKMENRPIAVFQVKFSRTPESQSDERAFIKEIVKLETAKIARLVQNG